jgi:uncharacterized protein involved in exopolysaccharide biosynthesis
MQEKFTHTFSMRELLVFFYKYRRRLVLAFCVPFVFAVGASFLSSPYYFASSVLIVRLGSEYVYQPEIGSSQTASEMPIPYQQDQIFKSEAAILGSTDLHQEVVESIGADELYPKNPLKQKLSPLILFIKSIPISLGLTEEPDPEERERFKVAYAVMKFNKNFTTLLEKESAVIRVGYRHQKADVAVRALDTLLKLYMEKRKKLYLEPRLEMAQDQVAAAHKKALSAAGAVDYFKRTTKLHNLETQRANLLSSRNDIEKQRLALDSPALDQKIETYNQKLDELDSQEHRFNTLEREAKIANDEYALAVHKVTEAKAFDDLARERVGSVRVIQEATVSPFPVKRQPLIIVAGFFLSILSVLLVAALTEFRKSGFLTPEELKRALGLPVLAVLPYRKG